MEEADDDDESEQGGKRLRNTGGKAVERPHFAALSAQEASGGKVEFRRVPVPPHRYSPLRKDWMQIYTPIVEHLKLDVRMNPRNRSVEIKSSVHTEDIDTLQKAADFVRAYILGFDVVDAVALLRVEDLYVDTFQVTCVCCPALAALAHPCLPCAHSTPPRFSIACSHVARPRHTPRAHAANSRGACRLHARQ